MSILDQARNGRIADVVKRTAESENVDPAKLNSAIASGRAALPANCGHHIDRPFAIGEGLRVKVNANIGTSLDYCNIDTELIKLKAAVEAGADAVMDLSTAGDLRTIRRRIIENSPVPVGSVPIYEAASMAVREGRPVPQMAVVEIFKAIENHLVDGIDFITVHCGVTRAVLDNLNEQGRVCGMVSRGGTFLAQWMDVNGKENPLYENFDDVIALAREQDATLSLGDGLRPGCLADAMDRAQVHELMILAELAARAREAGVQVMIEGPGHVPLHQIEAQVKLQKELCDGAPFYVLGPLVTDIAPGYDHITGAIGGAIAAMAGADFLCYVTPAEHLCLPTEEHVRAGVMASRIAAHAADIARGLPGAAEWDRSFAHLRRHQDWQGMLENCLDPALAARLREEGKPAEGDVCSMCGVHCVFRASVQEKSDH